MKISHKCPRCGLLVSGVSPIEAEARSRARNNMMLHRKGRRCAARTRGREIEMTDDQVDALRMGMANFNPGRVRASEGTHVGLDVFEGAARAAAAAVGKIREAFEGMTRSMSRMSARVRASVNDEVRVSGLEGRYFVRGSFADDLDALVLDLMTRPARQAVDDWERGTFPFLTPASRARLAVAAIRGHVHRENANC